MPIKSLFYKFAFIFYIGFIFAGCENNQTHKNEASLFNWRNNTLVSITKQHNKYIHSKYKYSRVHSQGTIYIGSSFLFNYSDERMLYSKNTSIVSEDKNGNKQTLFKFLNAESSKLSAKIFLSGLSPDAKHLIYFLDRRKQFKEESWMDAPMGPPSLYPDQDEISGFYLLNLETLKSKKINMSGSFLTWISNDTILIQDIVPFRPYDNWPSYFLLNTSSNSIVSSFEPKKKLALEQDSKSNRIVGRASNKTETNWVEFNSKTINIEIKSESIQGGSTNILKPSPFNSSILGIYPQPKKNKIYLDGKQLIEINHWDFIVDASWLNSDEIAIISQNKIGVFSISKKQLLFEQNLN